VQKGIATNEPAAKQNFKKELRFIKLSLSEVMLKYQKVKFIISSVIPDY